MRRIGNGGRRGQGSNLPASCHSIGLPMDGFRSSAVPPKNETNAASASGGQRQPPGGSQTNAARFNDHASKARMTQSFFRRLQCRILSAGLYMDDAIWFQPNTGQAGCKKVWAL